jgi:hypothetical protein
MTTWPLKSENRISENTIICYDDLLFDVAVNPGGDIERFWQLSTEDKWQE